MTSIAMTLQMAALTATLAWTPFSAARDAPGDAERGERLFRACAACHSVEPNTHRTGPSLARIWGREAGSISDFHRYSPALRASDMTWNEQNLDRWLADPAAFIPGNSMIFAGIADAQARKDLIAYLKPTTKEAGEEQPEAPQQDKPNLKEAPATHRVKSVRYCGDTYYVTSASGEQQMFWEFNLRFKTDSSAKGPAKGTPVLLRAGMFGDRASIIFSNPIEISELIEDRCAP